MTLEEVFDQLLKKTSSSRKIQNLRLINAACKEQWERKSLDFSISTIARLVSEKGGSDPQTIYNKTGEDFRGLIAAWCAYAEGRLRKPKMTPADPFGSVLERIDDSAVRVVIGSILSENRKLRGELNVLKSSTALVIDRRPVRADRPSLQELRLTADTLMLTETEREALRHAVSEEILRDEGWVSDPSGRLLSAKNGRVIQKPGYVLAIRKLLSNEEED